MRLIDSDKLPTFWDDDGCKCEIVYKEDIDNAPTIDPASLVKRGRWVKYTQSDLFNCTCTNCNVDVKERTPYCPWCGALMED